MPLELGDWWTEFADASSERRTAMLLHDTDPKKHRRKRKKPTAKVGTSTHE
jgi:poly(A) polymerase